MRVLLNLIGLGCLFLLVWLTFGRRLTVQLDRVWTTPVASLESVPIAFAHGEVRIGTRVLSTLTPEFKLASMQLGTTGEGQCWLTVSGNAFPLNGCQVTVEPSGFPLYTVRPAADDRIAFNVSRSPVAWPLILDAGGTTWRRNVYTKFQWIRPSGTSLTMRWRFEQWYSPLHGWSSHDMTGLEGMGLIECAVAPAPIAHQDLVRAYLSSKKGWRREEYRLEQRDESAGNVVVRVVYLRDESSPAAGGGESVDLYLKNGEIVREMGLQ